MEDGANGPSSQQSAVICINVVADKSQTGPARFTKSCDDRCVAAADRINGRNVGLALQRIVDEASGWPVAAKPFTDFDNAQMRIIFAQRAAEADLTLFLAAETIAAESDQDLG